jgi:anti-sigma B factor antagonist
VTPQLTVETSQAGEVSILRAGGLLNAHTVPQFDDALRRVLDAGTYRVVVNAELLTYVASAGLGALIGSIDEIREHGGDLRICGLNDTVSSIFEMVGLPHLFRIFRTEDEAVRSFAPEA